MNGFELPPAFVLLEACCLRLSVILLHFLWQGVLIGFLAVGVSRLLRHRSANARYVANAVALSMMALCLAVTFVMTPVPYIASIDRSDPAIHSVMDQAHGEPPMAAIQRGDDERPNDAAAVEQSPALVAANRPSEITPKDGFAAVPATVFFRRQPSGALAVRVKITAFSRVHRNKHDHGGVSKRLFPSKVSTAGRPVPQNPSGHPHSPSPTMIAP